MPGFRVWPLRPHPKAHKATLGWGVSSWAGGTGNALIAAANQSGWQAAELWLEHGVVVAINDLGEGVPPDDTPWPW
jgi:hypothetical protein